MYIYNGNKTIIKEKPHKYVRIYNDLINDGNKGEISQMKMATII